MEQLATWEAAILMVQTGAFLLAALGVAARAVRIYSSKLNHHCCCPVPQADVRQPDGKALSWSISADVEALTWNPSQPTCFLVSSEDGLVVAFDARKGAGAWLLWWRVAGAAALLGLSR